ncbi:MAG TPA: S41 family peptidase, partial [Phycisphaerae bacterium]|nr:S41 family peptidase [Phycisphaerae bacterium]
SMAEGLSFSLRDTGRAVLIGRPTMGLNAAIRNRTLSNGLVLRHSWVRTDRLGRGHYQGVGVEPHERVELGVADVQRLGLQRAIAQERELQLERAVQRLRALTAKAGGGA